MTRTDRLAAWTASLLFPLFLSASLPSTAAAGAGSAGLGTVGQQQTSSQLTTSAWGLGGHDATQGIGELEHTTSDLGIDLMDIRGLAFRDDDTGAFLYVLEGGDQKIHLYEVSRRGFGLTRLGDVSLPPGPVAPRGLAYANEGGADVLYFNDWADTSGLVSRLYRYEVNTGLLDSADLSQPAYEIDDRELLGVARQGPYVYVSFDPSSYPGHKKKVRRGVARFGVGSPLLHVSGRSLAEGLLGGTAQESKGGESGGTPLGWDDLVSGTSVVHHMPSANKESVDDDTGDITRVDPSQGLAPMSIDGIDYLWGSVSSHSIYVADAATGRGIFAFDRPFPTGRALYAMAVGLDHLWMAERLSGGPDVIHRISILDDVAKPLTGPKEVRRYRMRLTSDRTGPHVGWVQHAFGRPYPNRRAPNQGIFAGTHDSTDLSGGALVNDVLSYDPADDPDAMQKYTLLTYFTPGLPGDPTRFQSEMSIEGWTSRYRTFVYPHLTELDAGPPGTRYLDDDPVLFGVDTAPGTWEDLIERVEDWVESEYDAPRRDDNAYWRARDVMDYVLESYHYPNEDAGEEFVATVDYLGGHFNSNPGHLKAALSEDSDWSDNIIACSGTSMLQNGAMRHLGVPARWIGTSQERPWTEWTSGDEDEFLERDDQAKASNGHRYTEVWMGELYGWIRFDGTPSKPIGDEFSKRPKRKTQWELMSKAGNGIDAGRVIHNIAAGFWELLYVPFESLNDCDDNKHCGSLRYNLMGTYTDPASFERASPFIAYESILWVDDVRVVRSVARGDTVSWSLTGDWAMDADATLDIWLQRLDVGGWTNVQALALGHPATTGSLETEVGGFGDGTFRVRVTKTGDLPTGNASSGWSMPEWVLQTEGDPRPPEPEWVEPLLLD